MFKHLTLSLLCISVFGCSPADKPVSQDSSSTQTTVKSSENYAVLFGGTQVGELKVERLNNELKIDYGYSNNGRGSSSVESLRLSDTGLPLAWQIDGKTVFGNAVAESFQAADGSASWQDAAGGGKAAFSDESMYVAQNASPYSLYIYASALLNSENNKLPALPGGELRIDKIDTISLKSTNAGTPVEASIFAISGISLDPSYIALNNEAEMLGYLSPRFTLLRNDLIGEDQKLRELAAELNASRFEAIAQRATNTFEKPVRINNVRIFEPQTLSLSKPKSVLLNQNKIAAIEAVVQQPSPDEVVIDGNGGTLIPGLYEMHGHMSDDDALLNVMAGVTSVRDMGNEMEVLEALEDKIERNVLIGPRISKSAFIEGKSPFSNATGELAASEQEAVDLIKMYAERGGYHQIKIYSSVKGEWVPAMAAEAKKHGMRVAGHIPAFSKVDEMMLNGYDEVTHINQLMLSWVLDREEDTRTLFRITGMKRFAELDLNSEAVKTSLDIMVDKNIAIDPTMVIHEFGLTGRNGQTRVGMVDYIDHMPIGVQRSAKQALLNVADEAEDKAYKAAFEKILATLSLMHQRGIFIVPGTDLGGAFELHRELELFSKIGMSNAEVLRRASYDMANYLAYGEQLGSIETGKLADFFLVPGNPLEDLRAIKTVSLVAKDGQIYFPSEVYPEFGIKPFTDVPQVHYGD
ncbi:amidohydrolase family protein [Arsukibacterium sp. UBA3155]|uniref:amidohydrolase family protein n=1 Tax=Arsukibacterium sp. UBA3155 TaxID=1946058 RepID=UPI0025B9BCE6|nr:amidohydrolase family protein [Arsukibacterium sp. UBA3155]|tara:strand:- start:86765 stop:88840 length:2076 start_codon:yes stop_codon:yes gene_type:complete